MRKEETLVLVHGLALATSVRRMFSGVPEALRAHGWRVERTFVEGDATLEELADRLWAQLDRIDGPLVLLCHSMGGLQARTLMLDDARARRIRAVATVGSPHAGTPLAHFIAAFRRAPRDLTPQARSRWNAMHREEEERAALRHGIRCLSVQATRPWSVRHPQLAPPGLLLRALAGPSDGLVPVPSQAWGKVAFTIELDHIDCSVAGPWSPPAAVDLWVRLAERATSAEAEDVPSRMVP